MMIYVCQLHILGYIYIYIYIYLDETKKVMFRNEGNETEIDFVLVRKEHRWFLGNFKAIPVEIQHAPMVASIDENGIREVV